MRKKTFKERLLENVIIFQQPLYGKDFLRVFKKILKIRGRRVPKRQKGRVLKELKMFNDIIIEHFPSRRRIKVVFHKTEWWKNYEEITILGVPGKTYSVKPHPEGDGWVKKREKEIFSRGSRVAASYMHSRSLYETNTGTPVPDEWRIFFTQP